MITKIGINYYNNTIKYNNSNSVIYTKRSTTLPRKDFGDSFISFTGKEKQTANQKKFENIMMYADSSSKKMLTELWESAKSNSYDSITPMFVINKSLKDTYKYIEGLDNETIDYMTDKAPELVTFLGESISYFMFSEKELREKIKPVIKEYINKTEEIIKSDKPKSIDNKKYSC